MSEINTSRRDLARGLALLGLAGAAGPALAQPAGAGAAEAAVKAAYDKFKGLNEGKNADYMPALAKVSSNYFVIALVTPQG